MRHVPQPRRAAAQAGDSETTTRLWLKALAASDDGQGLKPDAALRSRVQRLLADPTLLMQAYLASAQAASVPAHVK